MLQAPPYLLGLERREAELGAPRLQGRDDLVHVVADHAESGVLRELLDNCAMVAAAAEMETTYGDKKRTVDPERQQQFISTSISMSISTSVLYQY